MLSAISSYWMLYYKYICYIYRLFLHRAVQPANGYNPYLLRLVDGSVLWACHALSAIQEQCICHPQAATISS